MQFKWRDLAMGDKKNSVPVVSFCLSQLEAMLGVIETAQCRKQFKSDDVELEAMKVISR